jgi:ferredoxin-NADP reductase
MSESVEDLKRQVAQWKSVAAYLAECHAASAETVAEQKKSSKYEKKRHAEICKKAAMMLKHGDLVGVVDRRYAKEGFIEVIERCELAKVECEK